MLTHVIDLFIQLEYKHEIYRFTVLFNRNLEFLKFAYKFSFLLVLHGVECSRQFCELQNAGGMRGNESRHSVTLS